MTEAAVAHQIRAADPRASSWVSANAGTGKTRVLTDRVARLLLGGTEPQRILCLTYTKAAAAEMQTRLFRTLGAWAMLPDDRLTAELRALGETGSADLARARTLFARALETPGGLRIQTIHAFCEALIRRFPLEAGVSPQFAVLEERQARALRDEILDALAAADPASFAGLARQLPGDDPDPLLLEIARHREAFAAPFDAQGLAAALGAEPDLAPGGLLARVLPADAEAALRALLPHLARSGKTDAEVGVALAATLALPDPAARLAGLEDALLTDKGTPRKLPAKAVRTRLAADMPAFDALAERLAAARATRLANAAFRRSAELDAFARRWLRALGDRKAALGLLDFDDLIDRARALLAQPGTAAWVLWRLDGGLDHILVDEAQDTSPAQWQVIEALSAEFFSGQGARPVERTIFVVGDEKQSIYSFQGADPAEFEARRALYRRAIADVERELQDCELLYSWRSAPPILDLVDAVFAGVAGAGLARGIAHRPVAPAMPGRVELWPFLQKPDRPEEPPWYQPVDARGPDDPVEMLAEKIAREVAGWLAEGRALPGADRAIRPGDVMILVQRRADLFHAVIRTLKKASVPVAGADLLRLGGELAVKDLVAALAVAATPSDDLSLAALLRSPLGGLTERELFELAHARPPVATLWSALRAESRWPEVRALVQDLLDQADFLRPHELLTRILIRHDGRRRLTARLGVEAEDGIDALVDQALAYESVEPPSLTGFLGWFERVEATVKRRTEDSADQVRVMTVHGAKGLEAPIVILPDTAARSDSLNPPQILRLANGQAVWKVRAELAPPAFAAAETARRELVRKESRRLLYVALTRPKSWLIVCGAGSDDASASRESWHTLVHEALQTLGPTREPGPDGDVLVLGSNWPAAPVAAPRGTAAQPPALPDWARRPARTLARAPAGPARALSPSGLGGLHTLPGEPSFLLTEEEAMARGTTVHSLLEHLHGRPAADRTALAARLLPETPDAATLLAEVAAILDAPDLAFLFAPGTFAEVDVAAPLAALGDARLVGRIDRLLVEENRVLAVDFKSHQAVPAGPEATPEGILRQMGAYRAALAQVFPGRRIETAILWTRAARLMPLPEALTEAALARAAAELGR